LRQNIQFPGHKHTYFNYKQFGQNYSMLFLNSPGPNKLDVIAYIRKKSGISLSEVKKLVETPEAGIFTDTADSLKILQKELEELGAIVSVKMGDGPCSVCGKPGYVQSLPGVPVSSCYCDEHVSDFVLKPISFVFFLILLVFLGWLIYFFVF